MGRNAPLELEAKEKEPRGSDESVGIRERCGGSGKQPGGTDEERGRETEPATDWTNKY